MRVKMFLSKYNKVTRPVRKVVVLLSGLICFLATLIMFPLLSSPAYAESISITGRGMALNTGGYLELSDKNNSYLTFDSSTKNFWGYIWSEDLGWIDFGDSNYGGPVQISYSSGKLIGRAYVLNTGGYIDFNSHPHNSNVSIDLKEGSFSGYAWSNDIGWIYFSGEGVPGN